MFKSKQWLLRCFIFTLLLAACQKNTLKEVNLEPNDKRPIYRLQVEEGDEAQLLQQQLGLEILRVEGPHVYFFARGALLDSLKVLGYIAEPVDSHQAFYRVVKVAKKGTEADLVQTGVQLINREKDHWVVRGNLTQLHLLKEMGYTLRALDYGYEPRPREVQILVKSREDVARVASFHVDIYNVVETKEQGLLIYAGAFDYQIDALRQNNFQVTIKSTLEEDKQ